MKLATGAGVLCTMVILASCRSTDSPDYAALSHRINPAALRLRPIASVILGGASDPTAVLALCNSGDAALRTLVNGVNAPDFPNDSISLVVKAFRYERSVVCQPDTGDGISAERCLRWCHERWSEIATAFDQAAAEAATVDVWIEPLLRM